MQVLAGTILPNGTFLGIVKVHGKASEAHLVVADDWADADGYKQSPSDESGNLFNASFHPPDGAQLSEWMFGTVLYCSCYVSVSISLSCGC